MKKYFVLAMGLSLILSQASHADWQKIVDCNSNGLVIDTQMAGTARQYQLVLRDEQAVKRFVDVTHLGPSINDQGELVVAIAPVKPKYLGVNSFFTTLPISSTRNGYINDLSADLDAQGTLTLDLVENGPTGPGKVELWKFYECKILQ